MATRAGQDSDCNPANAAGILGVMLGYKRIPEQWKSGIPAIADKKFNYTDFTFHEIVASTEKRALALIKSTGGQGRGRHGDGRDRSSPSRRSCRCGTTTARPSSA